MKSWKPFDRQSAAAPFFDEVVGELHRLDWDGRCWFLTGIPPGGSVLAGRLTDPFDVVSSGLDDSSGHRSRSTSCVPIPRVPRGL